MSEDMAASLRDQLDAVLFRSGADNYDMAVDLLLPLVERLRADARAEALDWFAAELDAAASRCAEWPEVSETYRLSSGAARYYANRNRADSPPNP